MKELKGIANGRRVFEDIFWTSEALMEFCRSVGPDFKYVRAMNSSYNCSLEVENRTALRLLQLIAQLAVTESRAKALEKELVDERERLFRACSCILTAGGVRATCDACVESRKVRSYLKTLRYG